MVDAQTQPDLCRTPAAGRQQIFMRAVVGSLVLCAALGGPTAQAREALLQGRTSVFASATFAVESAQRGRVLARGYDYLFKAARVNQPGRNEALVISNMTASANGKQFAVKLEMSREQAGNLLRQRLSLP